MVDFCNICDLKNLVKEPTCFENPDKPSCIDLFLRNCSKSSKYTYILETGLSDFYKINITTLKMFSLKA